jgi:hypothetical protein
MRDGGKMTEPLLIAENVREKIRGLIIITGVLEVGSPNSILISEYLNSSWQKLAEASVNMAIKHIL